MSGSGLFIPFPFSAVLLENVPPSPEIFEKALSGEDELAELDFGYCITSANESSGQHRYLIFFQHKPYAAGVFTSPRDVEPTSIRDFFVELARHPNTRLFFMKTDPILLKSIMVLSGNMPETQGSVEHLKLENQILDLVEENKDALVALVQEGRFSLAFAKDGRVAKAYFYDQFVETPGGITWRDLFRKIESFQVKGQDIRVRVYEDMDTYPAEDYLEGDTSYHGGVWKYYTRPMPEIIVRDKTRTLKNVRVEGYPFIIGRSDEVELTLPDPGVSRKHASISEEEGHVVVRDLESLNGIFVNDHHVKEYQLQDGDIITIPPFSLQIVLPRSPAEDVSLVSSGTYDATMAMDRHARVRIACPSCGAAGTMEAAKLYKSKKVRIRCPKCKELFDPVGAVKP
jgi:hypothetical protein